MKQPQNSNAAINAYLQENIMKKPLLTIFILTILALSACAKSGDENTAGNDASGPAAKSDEEKAQSLAEEYVKNLGLNQFELCLELNSASNIDPGYFANAWDYTLRKAGSFVSVEETGVYQDGAGGYICDIKSLHTGAYVRHFIIYDIDGEGSEHTLKDAGFYYYYEEGHPSENYDLPEGIAEEKLVVAEKSDRPLNGRLTLPENITAAVPAVILVHDFGPYGMDGNVYDNTPFRDIAFSLAKQGAAVYRYEKATFAYRELESLSTINIDTEAVYDAIAAKMMLENDPRIDSDEIYVLGLGYGGYLAPRISILGDFAGYVSMAGSPRNLVEAEYDREMYFINLYGNIENRAEDISRLNHEAALYYELDGMTYDEAAEIKILNNNGYNLKYIKDNYTVDYYGWSMPAFILQGTNDFQNFYDKDFVAYMLFLENNALAEFKLYDGLNHIFMKSVMEKPDFRDYKVNGAVDESALSDIFAWIKKDKRYKTAD